MPFIGVFTVSSSVQFIPSYKGYQTLNSLYSSIGTLSFPIRFSSVASSDSGLFDTAWRCCCCYSAPDRGAEYCDELVCLSVFVCLRSL